MGRLSRSQSASKTFNCDFCATKCPLEIVVDETLERRWGRKIKKKGFWRGSVASSHGQNIAAMGLRWLVAALVVKLPWSSRRGALPFVSLLLTTAKTDQRLDQRHRIYIDRTVQLVKWLRRHLANRPIKGKSMHIYLSSQGKGRIGTNSKRKGYRPVSFIYFSLDCVNGNSKYLYARFNNFKNYWWGICHNSGNKSDSSPIARKRSTY